MRIVASLLVALLAAAGVQAQTQPTVTVADMAFGTGYDYAQHAIEGAATTFAPSTARIFCATRITGAVPPAEITHVWYHEGKTMAKVTLKVDSTDWRTVSSKSLLPTWTGKWEVQVLDASGNVLKSMAFTVE